MLKPRGVKPAICMLAVGLLHGCSGVQPIALFHDHPDIRQLRVDAARHSLESLTDIDVLIRLDNVRLAEQIQSELDALVSSVTTVALDRMTVRFARQFVGLEGSAVIPDGPHRGLEVDLHGDVVLMFSSDGVVWQPQFFDLTWDERAGGAEETPVAPAAEARERWLAGINAELAGNLHDGMGRIIEVDPVPLGLLEVGASLALAKDSVAGASRRLDGVFTTAGSAILIEAFTTSIALDLNFVPSVFTCPANVGVARATFASEIRNREPVGSSRFLQGSEEINHFFTEITGAEHPTTVVHYWFADGRPVSMEELEVQPSARWRTWSSRGEVEPPARNWEVIVVEKASGCILQSMAILAQPRHGGAPPGGRGAARQSFNSYREAFERRIAGFSIATGNPAVALIEMPRSFVAEVLNEAFRDLELVTYLPQREPARDSFSAALEVFDASGVRCERASCESNRECIVDYDQCPPPPREHRSCVTCLLRNPLNNRCMREGRDPICEAARSARTVRLERDHEACIRNQQSLRERCERLRSQELHSCEIEAATAVGECEARRELIESLQGSGPVAEVVGQTELTGHVRLAFTGFRFDRGLENLRLTLELHAEMDVAGSLGFEPLPTLGTLNECVAGWRGDFAGLLFLPQIQSGLIGATEVRGDELVTPWSGVVYPVEISPAPIESLFVTHPGMLADCRVGLTVGQVGDALTGPQAGVFKGRHELAVQPRPTRFRMLPATMRLLGQVHSGAAQIGASHLRFRIGD